jgi:hypothetical protein
MQSASDLPPPPGALGFDWLGLPLPEDEAPGERASEEPPEEPLPVSGLMGKGSDMGDSVGTNDPAVGAVVVVVADGVSPAEVVDDPPEGVGDTDVDGADGVVRPGDTLGVMVRKVVGGAETLGLGAAPADERACANAVSGSSNNRAMAPRTGGLGVSMAITMALPVVPRSGQRSATTFVTFTTLRAEREPRPGGVGFPGVAQRRGSLSRARDLPQAPPPFWRDGQTAGSPARGIVTRR